MAGKRSIASSARRSIAGRIARGSLARYLFGMDEQLKADGARLEHIVALDLPAAYRSTFEELLLTFLDLAPRRDRTGTRDGRRAARRINPQFEVKSVVLKQLSRFSRGF